MIDFSSLQYDGARGKVLSHSAAALTAWPPRFGSESAMRAKLGERAPIVAVEDLVNADKRSSSLPKVLASSEERSVQERRGQFFLEADSIGSSTQSNTQRSRATRSVRGPRGSWTTWFHGGEGAAPWTSASSLPKLMPSVRLGPWDQTTRITDAQFPKQSDPSLGPARQRVGQCCKHRHAVEPMSLCARLDWW